MIASISFEGDKPYGQKIKLMNWQTQAIHYRHSDMAPISVMRQRNFGIWYLKLSSTVTPAMFADKKIPNATSNY
jgi:hypothetical protein